ncbi:MAG TPA: S41 family peptidase [Thermoanaerobaculia bacterium]|jgi:tricorn protease|nr:S41 family peptidase [Thermoanaerobaculia bacterium]
MSNRLISSCVAAVFFLGALGLGAGTASAQTKLLRFPDIHGDKVVFTYAGDLWTAAASGGAATRLTAHPGLEQFAKFSPDGKWIAFMGQYDGDEQVYVVPSTGGVPKQLTWYPARGPLTPRWGYDNQVMGWTRDGKAVLFRSMRDGWDFADTRLYTVPLDGSLGEPLIMPISGAGDFSPDGKRVVYTPIARDFRTWKRYQGGWAQDLYIFDLATYESKNITSNPRTDRDPMWIGDKIFFNSDRTGTLNLYAYDVAGGQVEPVTQSKQWDVRWPSSDGAGRIVYEMDGELHVLDARTRQDSQIAIQVPYEGLYDRPSQVSASGNVEDWALSPKGERAVFVARGDIFTAPIEKGPTRNLTRSSNAHDKWARWSPDGRKIAFISDKSGEEEVWLVNQDGSGKPEQLTQGGKAMRYAPEWAPDGKRLAFSDKDGKLYVLTVADRKLTEIADNVYGGIRDYSWSPCGGHLAYSTTEASQFRSIWIWSVEDGKTRRVTSDMFHEAGPVWERNGDYLYYMAAREYAPQLDGFELNFANDRNTGVYALALRKDVKNPLPIESDEVTVGEEEKKDEKAEDKKDEKKGEKKKGYTKIDFDGLEGRVVRIPVPFENYDGLSVTKDGNLMYVKIPTFFLGRDGGGEPSLRVYSLKDRKESTLAEGVGGFTMSPDGSKVLVQQQGNYNLYDATPTGKDSQKTLSTGGLVVNRVPREEWAEIFDEVWRRYRDFFYVENMHGYDWAALRDQYRPLVAHVGHRSDLNYVIGEMIAELNISHAYVAGGDYQLPDRPKVALPGARFALDDKAGRYKIAKIFHGQNDEDIYRSPLTEVGVDVKEGEYVLAIDGEELVANDNPYRLLRHKADRPVRMTVNSKPAFDGAREITFRPLDTETRLVYMEWVNKSRELVDKLSNGRVGYLHIPDMGEDGAREFIKWFYPQVRKEGLIVDVRDNGGGFMSQTMIERLRRELLAVDFGRLSEEPQTYPGVVFYGHMACLINEGSSSDGDIFPAMFKQAGMGPLIGKRTWGGVVGISGRGPLIDGGQIFVPEAGSASIEGEWIIEGHGVDPDIVVENDPKSVLAGRDPQLERGVAEVLKKMEAEPRKLPKKPAGPIKTQAGIEAATRK